MRQVLRLTLPAVLLVFAPFMLDQFETPKAALLRIAGLGLLAAALAAPRALRDFRWCALDVAMAAWLAAELAATLASRSLWLSVFGELEQHEGLLTSLALAGCYLGARLALRDTRAWRGLFDAWFAATALSCLYALAQAAHVDPLPWAHQATLGGVVRPFGTLGHPNLLGVVSCAAAAAAATRAALEPARRARNAAAAALFAVTAAITFSRAAWLGLAAGGGMVLASTWRWRARTRLRPSMMLAAGGVGVVAVGLALVLGGHALVAHVAETFSPSVGSGASRLEIWRIALRAFQARPLLGHGPDTFALVFSAFQTPRYWRLEWGQIAGHAHSVYLHTLATRGLVGVAASAGVAVQVVAVLWRSWGRRSGAPISTPAVEADDRAGILAAASAALLALAVAGGFGALGITGALLAALMVACVAWAGPAGQPGKGDSEVAFVASPAPRRNAARRAPAQPALGPASASSGGSRGGGGRGRGPRGAGVRVGVTAGGLVGAAVALALTVFSARDLALSRTVGQARAWFASGSPDGTRESQLRYAVLADRCKAAYGLEPWDDSAPGMSAALLLRWAQDWPDPSWLLGEATVAAREAVRRQPLRSVNHQRLAQVLAARALSGDRSLVPACEAEFARAAALAPCDAFVQVEWARARLRWGQVAAAAEPARRAAALYPGSGLAQKVLAEVALAEGDSTAARARLERAVRLPGNGETGAGEGAREPRDAIRTQ
jgi:O-antigen ligase